MKKLKEHDVNQTKTRCGAELCDKKRNALESAKLTIYIPTYNMSIALANFKFKENHGLVIIRQNGDFRKTNALPGSMY